LDPKKLHKTKYNDYAKFLDITNKKPNIFRDTIIESEYDPLEPNRRAIKVTLDPTVRDPTIIDQQKLHEEEAMLNPNCRRPDLSTGKFTLPVTLWAAEKICSTSFGFTPDFDAFQETSPRGDGGIRRSKRIDSDRARHTNVVFDHYSFPTGKDAIDKEMPRGKRTIAVHNTLILD